MTIQLLKFQLVVQVYLMTVQKKYSDIYQIPFESINDTYRIESVKWCRTLIPDVFYE